MFVINVEAQTTRSLENGRQANCCIVDWIHSGVSETCGQLSENRYDRLEGSFPRRNHENDEGG
jgi:hypothetical protein